MTGPRSPKSSDWLTPGVVLTLIGMAITAFAAYSTFNNVTDKRLQRVEDRVDVMWSEWLLRHGK